MTKIDQEIRHTFENDKQRFIANLVFSASWFKNKLGEFLKPFNLSLQQLNILRILKGADDWVTMSDVKDRMVEKAPNTTRLVDKMLQKELIERKRSDKDRRIVFVRISKKGKELLEEINDKQDEFNAEEIINLTEDEAKQASDLLEKMRS